MEPRLLTAVYEPTAPVWLREIPAMQTLRNVWLQYYHSPAVESGTIPLRAPGDKPPTAQLLQSPYEPDTHYATKREVTWVGYRLHLTETCNEDGPHLINHVATIPATINDSEMTSTIQAELVAAKLRPNQSLLDAGYAGSGTCSPVPLPASTSSARAPRHQMAGSSRSWHEVRRGTYLFIAVAFDRATCSACSVRTHCTRAATKP